MKIRPIVKCIYDPNFKSIFIENPNALASLISSVTNIKYELLKDNITIKMNEIPINGEDEKFKRCDFLIDFDNYLINIEVNAFNYDELKMKNTSYAMKLFSEKTKVGENYNSEFNLFQINIDAFSRFRNPLSKFNISSIETKEIYLKNFEFFTLDIVKCSKLFYNLEKRDITDYIRWGAFFNCDNLYELDNILGDMLSNKDKKKLIDKVSEINMRKDGTLTRREAKEWGRLIENSLKRKGYEEGKEEGREAGREEGIINTIKAMLKNNLSYEDISKITDKSLDEIKEIAKSMED